MTGSLRKQGRELEQRKKKINVRNLPSLILVVYMVSMFWIIKLKITEQNQKSGVKKPDCGIKNHTTLYKAQIIEEDIHPYHKEKSFLMLYA